MPKSCPIVHTPPVRPTKRTIREHQKACTQLNNAMLSNGLGPQQTSRIEIDAGVLDQCSNRSKEGQHNAAALRRHKEQQYPLNMYAHVQSVKAYQARDREHMLPNVLYTNVNFGCGGPFSAECLTGWDGAGLLTHRLHFWSDGYTHPKACDSECLKGWSGADLDAYRWMNWEGPYPDAADKPRDWARINYPQFAREYVLKHIRETGHWYAVDYSSISHRHGEQFHWNGHRYVRKNDRGLRVPETVVVPVPELLDQVLRGMRRETEEVDRASIEDILGRLPEAFEEEEPSSGEGLEPPADSAEESEGASTLVDEPVRGGTESTPTETPEMAEARRQRARKEMREKIARDFSSKGKEKAVEEEGQSCRDEHTQKMRSQTDVLIGTASGSANTPAETGNVEADGVNLTNPTGTNTPF